MRMMGWEEETGRTRPPEMYVPIDLVLGPTSNLGTLNRKTRRGSYDAYVVSEVKQRVGVRVLESATTGLLDREGNGEGLRIW